MMGGSIEDETPTDEEEQAELDRANNQRLAEALKKFAAENG